MELKEFMDWINNENNNTINQDRKEQIFTVLKMVNEFMDYKIDRNEKILADCKN